MMVLMVTPLGVRRLICLLVSPDLANDIKSSIIIRWKRNPVMTNEECGGKPECVQVLQVNRAWDGFTL